MPELTASNPSFELVNLNLRAVALCNEGANSRADILLTKRKESQRMPKTFEDLLKEMTPEAADVITKHMAGITAANETTINELNGKIETLEKQKPSAPPAPQANTLDEILKSASPEVQAEFTKMRGTIDTLVAAQQDAVAKERYELCKAIPVEEAKLKDVLKSASPAMVEVLAAASTAIIEKTLSPKGSEASGTFQGEDHYVTLEKAARKISAEENMTFEKAFTEACMRNPDVYKKYTEGVK